MSAITEIGWTDGTHNSVTWRCTPISRGCDNCYAQAWTTHWQGKGAFTSGAPSLKPDRLLLPLLDGGYRKTRRLFAMSMSDPFHPGLPVDELALMWAVWIACPQEVQILTKRHALMYRRLSGDEFPQRVSDALDDVAARIRALGRPTPARHRALDEVQAARTEFIWPNPGVIVGVSIEDQWSADRRLPRLRALGELGHRTMVSAEPLLGPVTMGWMPDWLITGGESGSRARIPHPGWLRDLRDQATATGTPLYLKQWGAWAPYGEGTATPAGLHGPLTLVDPDGGTHSPHDDGAPAGSALMARYGKSRAGRVLDGTTWQQFPPLDPRAADHHGMAA